MFGRAPKIDCLLNPAGALPNSFSERSDFLLISWSGSLKWTKRLNNQRKSLLAIKSLLSRNQISYRINQIELYLKNSVRIWANSSRIIKLILIGRFSGDGDATVHSAHHRCQGPSVERTCAPGRRPGHTHGVHWWQPGWGGDRARAVPVRHAWHASGWASTQ